MPNIKYSPRKDPTFSSAVHWVEGGRNLESRIQRVHLDTLRVAEVAPHFDLPVQGHFVDTPYEKSNVPGPGDPGGPDSGLPGPTGRGSPGPAARANLEPGTLCYAIVLRSKVFASTGLPNFMIQRGPSICMSNYTSVPTVLLAYWDVMASHEINQMEPWLPLVFGTLCYAIVLPGRKSAFRAGFWPDCYRASTQLGPPSGWHADVVDFPVAV